MIPTKLWLHQSVRDFWQDVNWENRAIAPSKKEFQPLSLTLSIKSYFNLIPWEEIAIAAAPIPTPEVLAPEKSETLDDLLSDVFQFF
jgi:hypothetical protein